jgi:hypothetical protein
LWIQQDQSIGGCTPISLPPTLVGCHAPACCVVFATTASLSSLLQQTSLHFTLYDSTPTKDGVGWAGAPGFFGLPECISSTTHPTPPPPPHPHPPDLPHAYSRTGNQAWNENQVLGQCVKWVKCSFLNPHGAHWHCHRVTLALSPPPILTCTLLRVLQGGGGGSCEDATAPPTLSVNTVKRGNVT